MLRRVALLALLLPACASDVDEATRTAALSPDGEAVCDVRKFSCDPLDPSSGPACDLACRFEGSYCLDHTPKEYLYCWNHPDSFYADGYRYCDIFGNPAWNTYCVAGPIAIAPPPAAE